MKNIIFISAASVALVTLSQNANAQFFKRLKQEVKNRAANHSINDAGM